MRNLLGWVGAASLSLCAVPQAWQSIEQGHSDGINLWFLALWTVGEICLLLYSYPLKRWPLTLNYIFNLLCLSVIIFYRIVNHATL